MTRLATYTCDECKAVKKEANHWWLVAQSQDDGQPALVIRPHIENSSWEGAGLDFCGIECASRFISRWMSQH